MSTFKKLYRDIMCQCVVFKFSLPAIFLVFTKRLEGAGSFEVYSWVTDKFTPNAPSSRNSFVYVSPVISSRIKQCIFCKWCGEIVGIMFPVLPVKYDLVNHWKYSNFIAFFCTVSCYFICSIITTFKKVGYGILSKIILGQIWNRTISKSGHQT